MSLPAAAARTRLPRLVDVAATRARLGVAPLRQVAPSRVPFVILVTFLLVGGAVTLLLFNTSLQQASFAEAALARQADTLAAKEQTLKLQLEDLRDPQRIGLQAQRMGMVLAPAPQFLELPSGRLVGEPGVASRETGSLRLQERPPRKPAALQPEIIRIPADEGRHR
jgi:hypothetical protein